MRFVAPGTLTDAEGEESTEYDDLGNVTSKTRSYTGLDPRAFDYTYYPDGSRATMVNDAGTWGYGYDADGRCVSMSSPAGTATFEYYDNGWEKKRTLPNSSYTSYTYNGVGMLTDLVNKKSDGTVRSQFGTFGYDGVFNLTGMTTASHVYSSFAGVNTFSYDTKDRLTQDANDQTGGSTYDYTSNFAYDSAGNPATFKGSSQSFNSDNQQVARGFDYDGNGSPTTYAGSTFTYDVEARLSSLTLGSDIYDFGYRADGLRAWKAKNRAIAGSGQPVTPGTFFYYDGDVPVLEVNSSDAITAVNAFAPDGLVARKIGSTWRHYQFDPQGSVAHRLTDNESVTNSSKYDAYGQHVSVPFAVSDSFGYNGRWGYYTDDGTGLILCGYRYYDAAKGRWVTRDPIGYDGGIDLYAYAGSQPNGSADPSGRRIAINPKGYTRAQIGRIKRLIHFIGSSPPMRQIVHSVITDRDILTIQLPGTNNPNMRFSGTSNTIYFNPDTPLLLKGDGPCGSDLYMPASVILAHELGHVPSSSNKGGRPDAVEGQPPKPGDVINDFENPFRRWLNLPKRERW